MKLSCHILPDQIENLFLLSDDAKLVTKNALSKRYNVQLSVNIN